MKTIAFVICLVSTLFLRFSDNVNHFKTLSEKKQKQVDSLTIMLNDLERDTIVHKMLTDFAYRAKVKTLVKVIPEEDIVKIVNKYKVRQKPEKKILAVRNKRHQDI